MFPNQAFRALLMTSLLAMGAPALASAQTANTGNGAVPTENAFAYPMAVTRGSVLVAEQTGGNASATGNPLALPLRTTQFAGSSGDLRVGNAASAIGGFGTEARMQGIGLIGQR
jgi:hypothetical protein